MTVSKISTSVNKLNPINRPIIPPNSPVVTRYKISLKDRICSVQLSVLEWESQAPTRLFQQWFKHLAFMLIFLWQISNDVLLILNRLTNQSVPGNNMLKRPPPSPAGNKLALNVIPPLHVIVYWLRELTLPLFGEKVTSAH